jgi:hypothetical protein
MSVNEAAQPITPNNAPYCKVQVRFMLGDDIALGYRQG